MADPSAPPVRPEAAPAPSAEPSKGTEAPKKVQANRSVTPGRTAVVLAALGVLIALMAAFILNRPVRPQPPAFQPAANPYAHAIFANGIIESDQASGENVDIFPEVSGPVVKTFVRAGERVRAGQPLFAIDDTVQRASAEQQRLQAEGAKALLRELKAQPRREALAVAIAQRDQAKASLFELERQRDKISASVALDPRSVSKNALDTAIDATKVGEQTLAVAQRQLDLIQAGAWTYDVQNQAAQCQALEQAYASASALLAKFVVKAPIDGVVLALNVPKGGYVSSAGAYDSYTQMNVPAAVLGRAGGTLAVRVFVDEILLNRLPKNGPVKAEMSIRGADVHLPLEFVRVEPFVTPKIELSNERQEQVDLRVLPVIFHFDVGKNINLYPGEEVDVYIKQ